MLLTAAARAMGNYRHAKLVLVGTGVNRQNPTLVGLVDALGLRDRVLLCGAREDIPAVYAAVDIAVSASRAESFPNSIAEAMASGLPCIATDVGDVRAIVGNAGIVVPPGDAAAFAAGLERMLMATPKERRAVGLAARERIRSNYTLSDMVDRYFTCFNKLIR